jgi:hypothetical protein
MAGCLDHGRSKPDIFVGCMFALAAGKTHNNILDNGVCCVCENKMVIWESWMVTTNLLGCL